MKSKTDYFKELTKLSNYCLYEADLFTGNIKNNVNDNEANDRLNNLQIITEKLRGEYFTPIEREDIFLIATNLYNLLQSLQNLNKNLNINSFFELRYNSILNLLYSAVHEIDNTVKKLLNFPKNDICSSAFTVKKLNNNVHDCLQNASMNQNDNILSSVKVCTSHCNSFSDMIIYIYLKNT